jgi:peroxisomal trans-2-enoyl-CoA reductase
MSVFRQGLFAKKTAIVTGGGTGIGKAIARELLELGANVVIASRKLDVLETAQKELTSSLNLPANQCSVFKCNIREEQEVKNLFAFAKDKFGGKIDLLINNGGGQFPSPAEMMSANGWRTVIDLNLNGTFLCCKEAFNSGMGEHGGSIVNIVCEMNSGFPGMVHTGAARSGVVNM